MLIFVGWLPPDLYPSGCLPRSRREGLSQPHNVHEGCTHHGGRVSAGVLTRGEAEVAHELARGVEAGEVAELRDRRDGHGELHATERLKGFDDWIEPPRLGLREQLGLEALQQVGAFGDGAHVLLEDDLLRGRGKDETSEPAQMLGAPIRPARVADYVAEQHRLQAEACG